MNRDRSFSEYRTFALVAARELGYGKDVINLVRHAKTSAEIEHIMTAERRRRIEEEYNDSVPKRRIKK